MNRPRFGYWATAGRPPKSHSRHGPGDREGQLPRATVKGMITRWLATVFSKPNSEGLVVKQPDDNSTAPQPSDRSAADSVSDRFRASQGAGGDSDLDVETSLWEGNYSPRALIGPASGPLLLSVGLAIATAVYGAPDWRISASLSLLGWAWVIAIYLFRRLSISYELTSQRFIHQSGLLRRRTDRIEVIDIDDVSFVQGPFERMLGIGTIQVSSTDRTDPLLVMPGIADVRRVAGMIDDVRRRERRRRSVHIQSM